MINQPGQPPKVLTIAGSDSGGAAGLQADLRTFNLLGVYGMSVVTAVTAQNSQEVAEVSFMPKELVKAQIEAVFSDYGASAVKSGFLGRPDIITAVADGLSNYKPDAIIIDPVLVSHLGAQMFSSEAVDYYVNCLFPLADLVTPNILEAGLIIGQPIEGFDSLKRAAFSIQSMGSTSVLIKSGRQGKMAVDVLLDNYGNLYILESDWIHTENTHGSGDTLSAAICAFLTQGFGLVEAANKAHHFTHQAIENARDWKLGKGHGPVFPSAAVTETDLPGPQLVDP